ncbi:mannose-6-phosphate isomerase, class I [Nocardioides sp. AX2bis]|uniref:mannose-6-phosphate isomerase, class I n=1 Tax=Nocardioides sp. AX2bis TaxID=2653157 RepID=UPI0012F3A401|nr:mannose-6-phosphate isomerase, class I [Nocardioides sp. AX2bis]VXC53622.1 Mannose-6-phosphate isomerase [Nocardioides sp. AX2bis]
MYLLTNPVRDYAWGSDRRLAKFLGRDPSGGPEAELWIGAHAGDPSLLPDGRRLDEAIAADPVALLGSRVCSDHGARLPFLMKILAVNEPLSLQVHPSAERARLGFGREERSGTPADAPERSYRDPWHKPELIYALTRFEGMAGFRDVGRSSALLALLDHDWAKDAAGRLETNFPSQTLRALVTEMMTTSPDVVRDVLSGLVAAAEAAAARGHQQERSLGSSRSQRDSEEAVVRREAIRVFELLPSLVEHYPDDPGVLVTLLLNHVVLAPGEAMFVGAGVVHAYASGFGVEIMAASDNVLRAGLTPKHRDVDELLDVTDFTPIPAPRWAAHDGKDLKEFTPPVEDFALDVGGAIRSAGDGPHIVLALDDVCEIGSRSGTLRLTRGQCVFVPADHGSFEVAGRAACGYVPG